MSGLFLLIEDFGALPGHPLSGSDVPWYPDLGRANYTQNDCELGTIVAPTQKMIEFLTLASW